MADEDKQSLRSDELKKEEESSSAEASEDKAETSDESKGSSASKPEPEDTAKEAAEEEKAQEEATEEVKEADESAKEAKEAEEEKKEEEKSEDKEKAKAGEPKVEAKAKEPKKEVKVSGKLAGIIKEIGSLSVLELADLVKALEDKFGVTAAAPVAVAVAGPAGPAGGEEAPAEEQTTFNVILSEGGSNKIGVIKAVREVVPTLGLKEAKDLVEAAPKPVLEGVNKESAQEAKSKLEAAGAKVELQKKETRNR